MNYYAETNLSGCLPRSQKDYEFKLIANFEDEFALDVLPRVNEASQMAIQHSSDPSNSKSLSLRLSLAGESTPSASTCEIILETNDKRRHTTGIPLYWVQDPKVVPSLVRLRNNKDARFFLSGDFGCSLDRLEASTIRLRIGACNYEVDSNWKHEGLCACKVQASHITSLGESSIEGEVLIEFPGESAKVIARIDCIYESE